MRFFSVSIKDQQYNHRVYEKIFPKVSILTPKVNIKARIARHSRVLQKKIYNTSWNIGKRNIKLLSLFVVCTLPIYPSFASFIYNTSVTDFDRRDIDQSSIISSLYFWEDETVWDGEVFIQSKDSYLHINAIMTENERDVSGTREIVKYEVKNGESIASIASKFNITRNSLYWANDFDEKHIIHPGDIIDVPPVSGVIHTVSSWETLWGLAVSYEVDQEDIMRQNLLLSASDLRIWDTIIIPGAMKKSVQKTPKPQKTYSSSSSVSQNTWWYSFAQYAQSEYVNTQGKFQFIWRKPYSWSWGNCTWYVASYKNVDWRGNANQWIRNAKEKGHPTWSEPVVGAIVQFEGRGYNPYYGHVAIVIDITPSHIIVSDMNYRRLNEVTTRKVPRNDRTIQWYIYLKD